MPRTIGIAIALMLLGAAAPEAWAETTPPANPPADAECRKVDRCIPTRDELDGKAAQVQRLKTRHDTVKNSINNVR